MYKPRIIISGGGTGGHIFPALSIANAIREIEPESEILFVGALGKMEMEKVPAAGYEIIGLPVAGLQRSLSAKNLALPFKIMESLSMAGRIIKDFKPDVAVGVGGYASAPLLWSASHKGIPCLIQEQNSYAGLTNRILSKRASRICTAYEGMERFFPAQKIMLTGNPIRKEIHQPSEEERAEGYEFYGLNPEKRTVFVVGGSLGCGTLNRVMRKWVEEGGASKDYQVIWQCGKFYKEGVDEFLKGKSVPNLFCTDFIKRMDLAYAVSDVIISRAGAGTISELCVAGKATIFVPSPNVSEDHQTHNAMALVEKDAAGIVKDILAQDELIPAMESLLADRERISALERNILKLGKKDASQVIAREVLALVK
ncbi:MAG: undecaprenyldiphospho-muramoylpentapeptide beta-N-acetylglucosaminyltransferase [Bacteroidales bacterium]|nr:undecaprenyldiphospho-muramoylpentapeptide beta-N-acetylglucosaminyltransferase [Candidatus Cacconaster equi]